MVHKEACRSCFSIIILLVQGILTKKNNKALEKELIINSNQKEIQLALIENKKLVELHNQSLKNNLIVGDIYLGKITKLLPGLNAAFVNIGQDQKDAFLHYTDLGPKLRSVVKFANGAMSGGQPSHLLDKFKIDDVVGAIPVHLFAGIWGTLAVPLTNGGASFGAQALGIVSYAVFTVVGSGIVWFILKATIGVRVSEEEEALGLDRSEVGVEAYPEFTFGRG